MAIVFAITFVLHQNLAASAEKVLLDRTIAAYSDRVITLSELLETQEIFFPQKEICEFNLDDGNFHEVLDLMVGQRLALKFLEKLPHEVISQEKLDTRINNLIVKHGSRDALEQALLKWGRDWDYLVKRLVDEWRLFNYLRHRLGKDLSISEEQVQRRYQELRSELGEVALTAKVSEKIRQVIIEEQINERLESWIEKLKEVYELKILL